MFARHLQFIVILFIQHQGPFYCLIQEIIHYHKQFIKIKTIFNNNKFSKMTMVRNTNINLYILFEKLIIFDFIFFFI